MFTYSAETVDILFTGLCNVMEFLEVHTLVDGTKMFHCGICGHSMSDRSNMRRHLLYKHTKPATATCPYCHKTFRNQFSRDCHVGRKRCLKKMLFNP